MILYAIGQFVLLITIPDPFHLDYAIKFSKLYYLIAGVIIGYHLKD